MFAAGVSVIVKGSLVGAVTESDGSYRIKARPSDQLSFSFLGQARDAGHLRRRSKTTIDEARQHGAGHDDVVVTALAWREEKSLGYAPRRSRATPFRRRPRVVQLDVGPRGPGGGSTVVPTWAAAVRCA